MDKYNCSVIGNVESEGMCIIHKLLCEIYQLVDIHKNRSYSMARFAFVLILFIVHKSIKYIDMIFRSICICMIRYHLALLKDCVQKYNLDY